MGSARLKAARAVGDNIQDYPVRKEAVGQAPGQATSPAEVMSGVRSSGISGKLFAKSQRDKAAKAKAAAQMREAEQAAAQKTAELANSAGGGLSISTNGQGSSSYTEGNPGQDDSQSHGDVDLSTSDTTLRRRGGYRRDAGIRI